MRKTPPAKIPAAEAPALDLFSTPAPAKRTPRSVPAQTSLPKAVSAPTVASQKSKPTKSAPAKPASGKTAKAIPVRAISSSPMPVRVVAETPATYFTGAGGRAWRMTGKHAVAYVGNAVLAGELLATEPRHLAKSAMAVYYDRKGKPFAWQLRFDTARWEEVIGRLA